MTRDEALQKIKKCLALAASPEPHEAAAAMRQAQKLMEQFGLTAGDVSMADIAESSQRAVNVPLVKWEAWIAGLVAKAFGCTHYSSERSVLGPNFTRRTQRSFVFIGVGAAPEVAGYAFDVLARQCAKDRRAHMGKQSKNCKPKTKVARGDVFAEGWVAGVQAKLTAFVQPKAETELIAQYMTKHYPDMEAGKLTDRTTGKNTKDDDFGKGLAAGRNANLNHGVSGREQQKQIGTS